MKWLLSFRLLLLAGWLGAAVFFVLVAQTAFSVMPSRELAGAIVTRTLALLNYAGIGTAIILVLMSLIVPAGTDRRAVWAERVLLVILGLGCAIGQFVFSWWLLLVRTQMGRPIDEVAIDDPLRVQFNNLHEYSTWTLLASMAAALLVFVLVAARRMDSPRSIGFDNLDFQKHVKI